MASLNKVMLIGNLGKDPELRYTTGGTAVASFSLATTEKFKGKDGNWEEKTEWHNITLWARLAEIANEYLSKGKTVYIEGRLQTRKWTDKEGKDRYTTEIVGEKMQMLSAKTEGGQQRQQGSQGQQQQRPAGQQQRPAAQPHRPEPQQSSYQNYDEPAFNPDDEIPF